jgi:hypothetical protein
MKIDKRLNARHSVGNTRSRQSKGSSGFTTLYTHYRLRALRRGYSWDLTKSQFKTFCELNCFYCGIEPRQIQRVYSKECTKEGLLNSAYVYNGLDRVDNSKGYSVDNCKTCCKTCNRAKDIMSYQDFKDWISRAYKNLSVSE